MGLLTERLIDSALSGILRLRRVDPEASLKWLDDFRATTRDVRRYRELRAKLDEQCLQLGLPPGRYARIRCNHYVQITGKGLLPIDNKLKGKIVRDLPYFEVPHNCSHIDVCVVLKKEGVKREIERRFEVVPAGYRPEYFDIIPESGPVPTLAELESRAKHDRGIAAALSSCNPTGPVENADIAKAVERLGYPIPSDLRELLLKVGSLVDHYEYGRTPKIEEIDTAYNQLFSIWWFEKKDIEHTNDVLSLNEMTALFLTSPDECSCSPYVCTLKEPYETFQLDVDGYGKATLTALMTPDRRRASVRDALLMGARQIGVAPSLPKDVVPLPGNLQLEVSWRDDPEIYFSDRPSPY